MTAKTKMQLVNEVKKIYSGKNKDGFSLSEYLGNNGICQFFDSNGEVFNLGLSYQDKVYRVYDSSTGKDIIPPFTNKADNMVLLGEALSKYGLYNNVEDKVNEIPEITQESINLELEQRELTKEELSEINNAFAEAKSFQEVSENITAPFRSIIDEASKMMESDPIMKVSDTLNSTNKEVQIVMKEFINTDGKIMRIGKMIPVLGSFLKTVDSKYDEAKFDLASMVGKLKIIFDGYDIAYKSLNNGINIQENYLNGIVSSLEKVEAYQIYINKKITQLDGAIATEKDERELRKLKLFRDNVYLFSTNLTNLIGNLRQSEIRFVKRLEVSKNLSISMNVSRPIFEVLLANAMVEGQGQKSLEAGMAAIETLGVTIDTLSTTLTDKLIEGTKKTNKIVSQGVLSTDTFVKNVEKLSAFLKEQDSLAEANKKQAEQDNIKMNKAIQQIKDFNVLSVEQQDELQKTLGI